MLLPRWLRNYCGSMVCNWLDNDIVSAKVTTLLPGPRFRGMPSPIEARGPNQREMEMEGGNAFQDCTHVIFQALQTRHADHSLAIMGIVREELYEAINDNDRSLPHHVRTMSADYYYSSRLAVLFPIMKIVAIASYWACRLRHGMRGAIIKTSEG